MPALREESQRPPREEVGLALVLVLALEDEREPGRRLEDRDIVAPVPHKQREFGPREEEEQHSAGLEGERTVARVGVEVEAEVEVEVGVRRIRVLRELRAS